MASAASALCSNSTYAFPSPGSETLRTVPKWSNNSFTCFSSHCERDAAATYKAVYLGMQTAACDRGRPHLRRMIMRIRALWMGLIVLRTVGTELVVPTGLCPNG